MLIDFFSKGIMYSSYHPLLTELKHGYITALYTCNATQENREMNRGHTIQIFNYANIIKDSCSVAPFPCMRLFLFLYILWNLFAQLSSKGCYSRDSVFTLWKMYFLTISIKKVRNLWTSRCWWMITPSSPSHNIQCWKLYFSNV